jgi:anaerobic selenocysteine-containing dehydrogenase
MATSIPSALVPEIEAGNVTTLIVVGGNPITALPDRDRTIAALQSLTALVVIDILPTETTELASHVLPAVDQLERADLTWLLDSFQLAVSA